MSILELAETYLTTTRPSELKKQGMTDLVDVMIRIRNYVILQQATEKKFKK